MRVVTPEYRCWVNMRSRCRNSRDPRYKWYGGRGITVCERWNTFLTFLADVGLRPSSIHTIDRIDNDGNYEPGNVRWATRREQQANTRQSRIIGNNGSSACLSEWARRLGIKPASLRHRLRLYSEQVALSIPAMAIGGGGSIGRRCWKSAKSASGLKGVYPRVNRFESRIKVDGKCRYLGLFLTAEAAALAYDAAAREVFGDYARTNFPLEAAS